MSGVTTGQAAVDLPHDDMAEAYVLGCLLFDTKAYPLVCNILTDHSFYNPRNREIYRAIDSLGKEGKGIDFILVTDRLEKQKSQITAADLMELTDKVASTSHLEMHAFLLAELYERRRLWEIGQRLAISVTADRQDVVEARQQAIDGMLQSAVGKRRDKTLSNVFEELNAEIEENQKRGGKVLGTLTGFSKIDEKGGLHKGDLVVVAGESSQGKTSFAISIARNAILRGAKVVIYSLEMTDVQMTARFLSPLAGISSSRILYGTDLTDWERQKIGVAMKKLPGSRLFFDDESLSSLEDILVSIRMMKARCDIQGAVVDYLQILGNNAKSSRMTREQILGDAARRLKNIAKELGVWVMALSQLSRSKESHEPTIDRIRDSGQIAEAADVVMLLYRPEVLPNHPPFSQDPSMDIHGKALVKIAKGRNIGIFDFFCNFDSRTTCFSEIGDDGAVIPVQEQQALPF